MKKVIGAVVVLMMGASLAIASDSACGASKDESGDPTCVTPVVKAAADVTKGAVDTVTDTATGIMERRQARREAVKEAVLGKGEEAAEKPASK